MIGTGEAKPAIRGSAIMYGRLEPTARFGGPSARVVALITVGLLLVGLLVRGAYSRTVQFG